MSEIKDRVKESWTNYIYRDVPTTRLYQSVYEDGYINGATEQRKIDIDKACEYLCADCIRRCTCQLPKEECGRLMSLRKEMEE